VERYRFLICDVWGVLHDGGEAYAPAVEALVHARATGCRVVALSNSPKRAVQVRAQLAEKGVEADALDHVLTSGELTRRHLERHYAGERFFHLGPIRDRATVEGVPLHETDNIETADVIVATGLVHGSVEAHDELLAKAAARGVDFLCANPDRVVRLGAVRELCAGVLADRYVSLGGNVIWLGKPAELPYRACRRLFAALSGKAVSDETVLAIGDGLATDIVGAVGAGFATLLIEDGVHREELAAEQLEKIFERYGTMPTYRMQRLVW